MVHDNGNTTTTEYAGNYIYENSVLKFFSHPEGYVEPNGVSYEYVYQYKDHLGNIRLSYSDPNDSYQDILDSDLTNSYNGWVHNGVVTSELVNGTLRVDVNSSFEGIKNELPNLTVSPGDVLDISLVFDKGNTLSNVRLYFQELDANGNHVSWNTIDTNLQTGTHSYTYTVNAGNRLTLRIDKDNTNTNSLTSFYVDHVSVTTGALEILEENNYYPFGLKHKGYNDVVNSTNIAQKYKYNGKELNDELGLDWYDYGARNYDASLGRWMNVDPLAENYYDKSSYNYTLNNPVFFVDPDGRTVDVTDLVKGGTESDTWLLIKLMADLSFATGEEITSQKNKDGTFTLVGGACRKGCDNDTSVNSYVSNLINDDSDTIIVKNNLRNKRIDSETGEPAKLLGTQAWPDNVVFLDAKQINNFEQSINKAGGKGISMGTGFSFLHETLHTPFGSSFYNSDKDNEEKTYGVYDGKNVSLFRDPQGVFQKSTYAGPVVDRINAFRRELGLPERITYTNWTPNSQGSLVLKIKGTRTEVPVQNYGLQLNKKKK